MKITAEGSAWDIFDTGVVFSMRGVLQVLIDTTRHC